jgi:hypothetical protein
VLFLGGAVLGAVLAVLVYFLTVIGFDFAVRAIQSSKQRRMQAVKR